MPGYRNTDFEKLFEREPVLGNEVAEWYAFHSTRIFPQHSGVMSAQPCLIRGVATAELSESFTKTIADSAPGLAPGKGTIHLVTVTDGVITVYSATSGISGALHYPFCRLDKEFRFREQQMAMSESFTKTMQTPQNQVGVAEGLVTVTGWKDYG